MKLLDITSDYKSFADNQLLTAAQLNLLVQYLDNQDRLSRLALTGAGIVCGLEISASNTVLTISQGTALTTDGDLIKLKNKNSNPKTSPIAIQGIDFVAFIPFNNHKIQYEPFLESKDTYIPILELLTEEEAKNFPTSKKLSEIKVSEFVVVLYLENYTMPYDVCNESDCESQGIPEISRLRYFLIDKEIVEKVVLKNDSIFKQFGKIKELTGKILQIERVIVPTLIQKESIYLEKYNDVAKNSSLRFNQACKELFEILNSNLGFELPLSLKAGNIFVPKAFPNAQYNYDFLLDLLATYNEIKDLALKIDSICNHNIGAFPKHILLGSLEDGTFRHSFYKSSALANDQNLRAKINLLLNRFDIMLRNFNGKRNNEIQIRASKLCGKLSDKAIPRYYLENSQLRKNWKFESTENYQNEKNSERNLGFDLTCHDFFRIEGAFDLNWATALDTILKKKIAFGLNFDVICLSSNQSIEDLNLTDYPIFFQDLQTNLSAWKAQQICLLQTATTFLTGFSTKADGGHNHIRDYFMRESLIEAVHEKPVGSFRDIYGRTSTTEKVKTTEVKSENPKEDPKKENTSYAGLFNVASARKFDVIEEVQYYKQPAPYFPITKGTEDIGKGFEFFNEVQGNYSFHDLVAIYEGKLGTIITDLKNWDEVDKEIRVTYPTKLLAAIQTLNNEFPTNINSINEAKLRSFEAALDNLCKLTNQAFNFISETVNDPENEYVKKDFEDHYLAILNRLKENCCAGDFLKVIFQETLDRKRRILDDTKFSNFVAKHPGLEHMAGVPNSGTFVLLYDGKSNKVVADFALPYICCSKSAPIAFMVTPPIEEVGEVQFDIEPIICKSDKETIKVPFEIIPEDANLQFINPLGGIKINKNILSIDSEFKRFGTKIQFQVNGKLLEKTVTILEKKQLRLSYEFNEEKEAYQVNSNLDSNDFQWQIEGNDIEGESSRLLSINESYEKDIMVSLKIMTPCGEETGQISISPISEEEPVTFSIEPTYCKDPAARETVKFALRPEGTSIKLVKEYGGISISGSELVLTAEFKEFETPIKFEVNGKLSNQEIIIRKNETLILTHDFEDEKSIHTITSNISSDKFQWYFNGKRINAKTSLQLEIDDIAPGSNSVSLTLQTECGSITEEIKFEHKGKDENTCLGRALHQLADSKGRLNKILNKREINEALENDLSFLMQTVKDFENDPSAFIGGNLSENFKYIIKTFTQLNTRLISDDNGNQVEVIVEVYKLCMEILYAMLTCMNEKVLKKSSNFFSELFITIEGHLKDSSYSKKIQELRALIQEIIQFRTKNGANEKEDILIVHLLNIINLGRNRR